MSYYIAVLKKYATFTGRARRSEYWYFALFNIIFSIVAIVLDNVLGVAFEEIGYGFIYLAYLLGVILPSLSVLVRRLHDTGKSGFWFFISFIPLVGGIILLVFLVKDSDAEENAYGPNPKVA